MTFILHPVDSGGSWVVGRSAPILAGDPWVQMARMMRTKADFDKRPASTRSFSAALKAS
jgi:hypothetical protein